MADRPERKDGRRRNSTSGSSSKRKKVSNSNKTKGRKKNSSFAIFFVITMIIGIVVCVVLFALAYQTLVPPRIISGPPLISDPGSEEVVIPAYHEQDLGMVTAINSTYPQHLTLLLLESGQTGRFNMAEGTTVRNRYGAQIDFREIDLGQIVNVTFETNTRDMSELSLSSHAVIERDRSNVIIDLDASTITIGNQVYTFSSRTLVLNRGEPFSINLITPEDVLTLVRYQDKIWSIRIDTGHGFIRFENADGITGGTVAVGTSVFTGLDPDRPVSALEGAHRVIIEGQNIETYITDVTIRQGETIVIDLANVVFRQGTLQLVISEPGASILINGETAALDEDGLIELDYGTHQLRVERAGFVTINQTIDISQVFTRLELNLVRDVVLASIAIETLPAGAQIYVDGTFVGNSPITVEVEYGSRLILARLAGYDDWPLHLIVDEHSPRQYFLHLIQTLVAPPPPPDDADESEWAGEPDLTELDSLLDDFYNETDTND